MELAAFLCCVLSSAGISAAALLSWPHPLGTGLLAEPARSVWLAMIFGQNLVIGTAFPV